jgi:hypothetical protein
MSRRWVMYMRWLLYIATVICLALYWLLPKFQHLWKLVGVICFLLQGPFIYLEQSQKSAVTRNIKAVR